jgi:cell division protein FtsQ
LIALAALLVGGYLLWLRDSSLVRVETVTVTGLTSDDAARMRAALTAAAEEMTTLHVERGKLEDAIAAFPVVRSIDVQPDFPSGMRIHVVEHRPAALLISGPARVPVAADGSVLRGLPVGRKLPAVRLDRPPPARRLSRGAALAAVQVAGGLPGALGGRVEEVRLDGASGVIVPIQDGPKLIFGRPTRLKAKWAAAVRVLADEDAAGAAYIDVRIPERPVAGGLPVETVAPVAPAGESPASAAPPEPIAGAHEGAPQDAVSPTAPTPTRRPPPAGATPAPAPRPLGPPPQATGGGAVAPNPQP